RKRSTSRTEACSGFFRARYRTTVGPGRNPRVIYLTLRGETSMTGSTRIRSASRGALVATAMAMGVTMGAGTAQAVDIRAITDQYLFSYSLSKFETTRNQRPYADQLDWSS